MLSEDVNGVGLAYAESGNGPDTFFVHGIPTDYRAWNAQLAFFSKSYHVTVYSRRHALPNNNQGSLLESTIENNARDLEELIRKNSFSTGQSGRAFIRRLHRSIPRDESS